jgi:hypothetical protein
VHVQGEKNHQIPNVSRESELTREINAFAGATSDAPVRQ